MSPIVVILILTAVALIIGSAVQKNKKRLPIEDYKGKEIPLISGEELVAVLHDLDYFKYADPEHLEPLIKEITDTFDEHKVLTTVWPDRPPFTPYCKRYYCCNGETLYKQGGVVSYLEDLQPTFDKLNIPLVWSNDDFPDNSYLHTIVLNGKKYILMEADPEDPLIWGWATRNFVKMLNDQLALHNSDERIYPILGGHDGRIVFLTIAQYEVMVNYIGGIERPMEVYLWWHVFSNGKYSSLRDTEP